MKLNSCLNSRMDKEGKKPSTYVSTFSLALKPKARPLCVERQKENGLVATNRTPTRNNRLEVSSATGKDCKRIELLKLC